MLVQEQPWGEYFISINRLTQLRHDYRNNGDLSIRIPMKSLSNNDSSIADQVENESVMQPTCDICFYSLKRNFWFNKVAVFVISYEYL